MSNNLKIQEMSNIEEIESYFDSFKDSYISLYRSEVTYLNDYFIDIFSYLFHNGIIYSTSIKYSIKNIDKYGFFSIFTTESLLYLDETENNLKHLSNSEYNQIYQQQISFFQEYIKKSKDIQLLNDNTEPLLKKTISFFAFKNNKEPEHFSNLFLQDSNFQNNFAYILKKYFYISDALSINKNNFLFLLLDKYQLFNRFESGNLLFFCHIDSVLNYLNSLPIDKFISLGNQFCNYILKIKITENFKILFLKYINNINLEHTYSFFHTLYCYIDERNFNICFDTNLKIMYELFAKSKFDYSLFLYSKFVFNKDFNFYNIEENYIELFFLYFLNTQKHFDNIVIYKEHFHPIIQRNIEKKLIQEKINNF